MLLILSQEACTAAEHKEEYQLRLTQTERDAAQQGRARQVERGNKTTVRTGRGDAIEMKGWMGGSIVRAVFVSAVCDCPVGLLHLGESKKVIQ